jgi:hypothetical protein
MGARRKGDGEAEIRPITFRQACDFIAEHHRHHKPTVGCKFAIGLFDGGGYGWVRCVWQTSKPPLGRWSDL